jgi:hypothetical protein
MRYALCWPHLTSPLLVRAKKGKEREDAGAEEREIWPSTAPHLGAEEQGQQPAEGGGRGVAAELWGPPPAAPALRHRWSQGRRGAGSGSCRPGRCSCSRRRRGLAGDGLVPPVKVVRRAGDGLLAPLVEAGASRGAVDDGAAHECTATTSCGRRPPPEPLPPRAEEK